MAHRMRAHQPALASVATRIAPALTKGGGGSYGDQVTGPDGPVPLDEVREPITDLLAGEHVGTRAAELVAESGIETHPERL